MKTKVITSVLVMVLVLLTANKEVFAQKRNEKAKKDANLPPPPPPPPSAKVSDAPPAPRAPKNASVSDAQKANEKRTQINAEPPQTPPVVNK